MLIFLVLPVYSLLLWYLGKIYKEYHTWSWISFLMNIAYCALAVMVFEFLNVRFLKRKSFSTKRQQIQAVFMLDFGAFLLLQTVILFFLEQLESTVTIIITYSLNGMLTAVYVFIYYFTTNKSESISPLIENQEILIKAVWKGKTTFISVDHFMYFETVNKITFGYAEDNRLLTINKSLTELEKELPKERFFRTNRQVIIRKGQVERFERLDNNTLQVHLKTTDKTVIVSRSKVTAFKCWILTSNDLVPEVQSEA